MTDPVRSRIMASVRQKDTNPEVLVRKLLHSAGFRYRLHVKTLPGSPDLVLPKYKLVIFVHGCFWHFHKNCKYAKIPAANEAKWRLKLEKNVSRDKRQIAALLKLGWRVLVIWGCALKKLSATQQDSIFQLIKDEHGSERFIEIRSELE